MSTESPVWVIYDQYKTARLNVKYYGYRMGTITRQNFWLEIFIAAAAAAPASAVAGIPFFLTPTGEMWWKVLAVLAAIAAFFKPFLRLPTKLKSMEKSLSGYRALDCDLEEIVNKIKLEQNYSKAALKMLENAQKKKRSLVGSPPEHSQSSQLKEKCFAEVNKELPSSMFYIP